MAALLALGAALAAWAGWFIWRTSFTLGGGRVFCLFDDAMISMTYARNLVEGYGLNWARWGAPVEGFTHPLWTALMVPVNLLPIGLERRSLVVQLVSLGLLLWNVVLVRRLMLRHFSLPGVRHWAPACVLTAFYYPLDYWALMGMETGLQALLTTASVLLALDIVHGEHDRHLALLGVGTLAVLLRMDMAPLVVVVQLFVLAHGGLRQRAAGGRRRLLHWLAGAAVLGAAVGGYEVFRWIYFHDLLPNTYYLKLSGVPLVVRLLRGGSRLLDTLLAQGPLPPAVAIGLAPLLRLRRRGRPGSAEEAARGGDEQRQLVRDADPGGRRERLGEAGETADGEGEREWGSRLVLPLAVLAVCCAYSVYVGGDAWEGEQVPANRFVAFAMPQLFVLFNALLNRALAAVAGAAAARGWRVERAAGGEGDGGGAADPALTLSPMLSPVLLATLARLGLTAATVAALLAANGLWRVDKAEQGWRNYLSIRRPLAVEAHQGVAGRVRALQRIAAPSARVAVIWAGIPAYFSDFRLIDELGYNDRHIAHGKPARGLTEDSFETFSPGHVKEDVLYVLEVQRPDAYFQTLRGVFLKPRLLARGYANVEGFWVQDRSPAIHLTPADLAAARGSAAAARPGAAAAVAVDSSGHRRGGR